LNFKTHSKQDARAPAVFTGGPHPFFGAHRVKWLALVTIVLVAGFSGPLWKLCGYAWASELFSYILLVPLVSIFFAWSKRRHLALDSKPTRGLAAFPLILGAAVLAGVGWATYHGWTPSQDNYLAAMMFAFLSLFLGSCLFVLGTETVRQVYFSLFFLFFMVPFPTFLQDLLNGFLQRGSADVAQVLFELSGMPLVRQNTVFILPGFRLEVAPECSGIHSTVVLFITSLVAGQVCLRSHWRRAVLTLAVIPLALLRNGLRVFTIGQLCVNVSPDMINSFIHRRGGPIFFALSLVPFFLTLLLLWKSERRVDRRAPQQNVRPQMVSIC
jgi:exosortase C (VPDSG-CTERM-specific)